MNKLTIPAILAATVMVAGIFAFMPVEQASTVHTSGTITIANDAITAAKIAASAIGASELATDAIGAAEIAADAVTEVQTLQIELLFDADMTTTNVDCTSTDSSFLVHYIIGEIADTEVVTIFDGTNTMSITADIGTAGTGTDVISGTIGGVSGITITFGAPDTVEGFFTIVAPAGATASCTSA